MSTVLGVELEHSRTLVAGPLDLSCLRRSERSLLRKEWPLKRDARGELHVSWCRSSGPFEADGQALTIAEMAVRAGAHRSLPPCCRESYLAPGALLSGLTGVLAMVTPPALSPSSAHLLLLGANLDSAPPLQPLSSQVHRLVLVATQAGRAWVHSPAALDAVDAYTTFRSVKGLAEDTFLASALGFEDERSFPRPVAELSTLPAPLWGPDRRSEFLRAHEVRPRPSGSVLARSSLSDYSLAAALSSNALVADALATTAHPADPRVLVLPAAWAPLLDHLGSFDKEFLDVFTLTPEDDARVLETALVAFPDLPLRQAVTAARALES
jgi:hypothetical protein